MSMLAGQIEAISGPMFAGKTTELIRRLRGAKAAGLNVLVFKHSLDTRYGDNKITTHDGMQMDAIPITDPKDMVLKMILERKTIHAIGIDEVSLFSRLSAFIPTIKHLAAKYQIRVVGAGIDRDFKGDPMGVMPEFLCMADEIVKLYTVCWICHGRATMTQRLVGGEPAKLEDPLILVGGKNVGDVEYQARCKWCHKLG